MIPSLSPSANLFLIRTAQLQSTINAATARLSSGYRISQPSDAPDQISPLLQLQASLAHNQAVSANLNNVQVDVSSADQAVSAALQMLDQALSLGAQGASAATTAANRTNLAQQILSIQQQMVGLANTQVAGRYVFSGDQDLSAPYALGLTQPVQVGQAAPASLIKVGDTAVFMIQTTSGLTTIPIAGQAGDTLQGQVNLLNSKLQGSGISASLDATQHLQFASSNAFSVSAQATGHANLVALSPASETANNLGLNYYQYTAPATQAGGGSHVQIMVGGTTVIATLNNPAAPTAIDINAINNALQAKGITTVSAVLDQTAANAISFQGSVNFSISDDSGLSGTYVPVGASTAVTPPLNGVDRLLTAPVTATRQVEMSDRSFTTADQTAQDLFDHRNADDSLAPDNVFAALNSLRLALTDSTNPAQLSEITAAQASLQAASAYLNSKETFYGNTQTRITAALNRIDTENLNLQQQISDIRETDVVQTALELTSAETQNQAAMAAEAKAPHTSLFDFLG